MIGGSPGLGLFGVWASPRQFLVKQTVTLGLDLLPLLFHGCRASQYIDLPALSGGETNKREHLPRITAPFIVTNGCCLPRCRAIDQVSEWVGREWVGKVTQKLAATTSM